MDFNIWVYGFAALMKAIRISIIFIVSVITILSFVPVFAGQKPVTYTASLQAKTGTFKASKKAKAEKEAAEQEEE